MNRPNLYIIRYSLPPEPVEVRPQRLHRLQQVCRDAKIDEVMFFLLPEEYNRGQWRQSDYRPWLDFAAEAKAIVEQAGLAASINPWHTLLHIDRGRRSLDLHYRRMVLDTGQTCLSVACPLCPQWQRLFVNAFTDFAGAGFRTLWIEDDFRFHNHGYGAWGGCFCDEHIRELRRCGAEAASRQELLANLNAADKVHGDRLIWQRLMSRTQIDIARQLRQAMDAIDPRITLGLMTSHMACHDVEGRDWATLIETLGGPQRVPVRPHAAGYAEASRNGIIDPAGNLSATLNALPRGTKTFFELENAPTSRFTKSSQQTAMQMAFAIEGGCDGLTLDVLDFLGSGPVSEPTVAPMLAAQKDKLLTLREQVRDTQPLGVLCLQPLGTASAAPGSGSPNPFHIPTIHYGWFTYLQACGYPCTVQTRCDRIGPDRLCALAGPSVWTFAQDTLENLLSHNTVLLDAIAAEIIHRRGLGRLIGLEALTRLGHHERPFILEEALEVPPDRVPQRASINAIDEDPDYRIALYQTAPSAQPKTRVLDADLQPLGTGSYAYANDRGGKGIVLPTPLPPPIRLYTRFRKLWLDQWLEELGAAANLPRLVEAPWVYISARSSADVKTIFLANAMFEVYDRIELLVPQGWTSLDWSQALHGRDCPVSVRFTDPRRMAVTTEMVGNDWLILSGR